MVARQVSPIRLCGMASLAAVVLVMVYNFSSTFGSIHNANGISFQTIRAFPQEEPLWFAFWLGILSVTALRVGAPMLKVCIGNSMASHGGGDAGAGDSPLSKAHSKQTKEHHRKAFESFRRRYLAGFLSAMLAG